MGPYYYGDRWSMADTLRFVWSMAQAYSRTRPGRIDVLFGMYSILLSVLKPHCIVNPGRRPPTHPAALGLVRTDELYEMFTIRLFVVNPQEITIAQATDGPTMLR